MRPIAGSGRRIGRTMPSTDRTTLLRIAALALAGLCLLAMSGSGASAKTTLRDAVRAEDKARITAKPVNQPADRSPKIEVGGDEDQKDREKPNTITLGGVKVELSFTEFTRDGDKLKRPVLVVSQNGKEVARLEQKEDDIFMAPFLSIQIAELDAGNQTPEVVVSFYTGGAHCCSDTKVIAASGDSWSTIAVGQFDGGPMLAADLDGDGRYEFATRDNAYLYAFGCYACSSAPQKIIAIENGKPKVVSAEPRFRAAQESWLRDLVTSVDKDTEANAFLAGYVAQKVLLGEGKAAWKLMLAHYDKKSEDGIEQCPEPVNAEGECPVKMKKYKFPDALKKLLNESGYPFEP